MNKAQRDAIRADYNKVVGNPYSPEYGVQHNIAPISIDAVFRLIGYVPTLLDDIERLETENATLKKQLELATKWISTIEDDGMEVYDDMEATGE